ncbi:MAG TPA: FISUMP domain-containing protein [Bacteroidales bacterium]|nr:FISUMP domain-containing protein [Bacteroidales bacterium]HSA43891.1 FISUMP domain-containing protein [Bacteroidales bacterium]
MKKLMLISLLFALFSQAFPQHRISGNVCYDNEYLTYLDSVTVLLKQGNVIVSQTNTDQMGHFQFSGISDGTYTLSGYCSKNWGGGSSTDALRILQHFVHIQSLTSIRLEAADVDNNSQVNTTDALMVSRRYIQLLDSFPAGDWVLGEKQITLAGNDIFANLKATCMGDVNASFTPPAVFTCGQTLTDTRDDQIYPTVLIGEQCWMAKNMNIGTFIYGVGNQGNNYVIEKYCYQNNLTNCYNFGGLYQWDEMMQYDTTPGVQGICPAGFHIPTDSEWDTVIYTLGGYAMAGGALKVGGSSGFNGLLAGWVIDCQKFRLLGTKGFFWSSTPYYGIYGYDRTLLYNSNSVTRDYADQEDGLSVRCLKD